MLVIITCPDERVTVYLLLWEDTDFENLRNIRGCHAQFQACHREFSPFPPVFQISSLLKTSWLSEIVLGKRKDLGNLKQGNTMSDSWFEKIL